jgi:hypothetical protein
VFKVVRTINGVKQAFWQRRDLARVQYDIRIGQGVYIQQQMGPVLVPVRNGDLFAPTTHIENAPGRTITERWKQLLRFFAPQDIFDDIQ